MRINNVSMNTYKAPAFKALSKELACALNINRFITFQQIVDISKNDLFDVTLEGSKEAKAHLPLEGTHYCDMWNTLKYFKNRVPRPEVCIKERATGKIWHHRPIDCDELQSIELEIKKAQELCDLAKSTNGTVDFDYILDKYTAPEE